MPAKEIKELRQAGRLEEALEMAQNELNAAPENIWGKRNLSWVYYEFLKKNNSLDLYASFIETLSKIKDLQLPEEEKMLFDSCAWQVGSMIFTLQKNQPVDYQKINEVFGLIKEFHFTKPSEGYSFIYKAFHKGYKEWSQYSAFADWWNFENFQPDDFKKEEYNGRTIMSLAEQAYIAYSKKLLEGSTAGNFGQERTFDKDKIRTFLPRLDTIIKAHPEYQYPAYFKAKLLLLLGDSDNVLSAFLPFAKQKQNDFWVWELMAEIFDDNPDLKFSCYCKALSLRAPKDFLIKTREAFAELLVNKGMYDEARTEIEQIVNIRNSHEWKLSNQLANWLNQDWYNKTTSSRDNISLYKVHLNKAEEILYKDIPEEIVVVEFVNHNKGILNYVQSKSSLGFFRYQGLINQPRIGDILKVRFNDKSATGMQKVFTLRLDDSNTSSEAIKPFEGKLSIKEAGFGFIDGIFFDANFIKKNKLEDSQTLNGKAILSYNKRKEQWGYKAFEVS